MTIPHLDRVRPSLGYAEAVAEGNAPVLALPPAELVMTIAIGPKTWEADGQWRAVDQSVHGDDFWQTDYDPARRTWSVTYTVPLDSPGDRRLTREFRFRAR